MGRTKGLLPLSGNFEPQVAGPFDARSRVETKADLLLLATWQAKDGNPYTYVGMVVTVYADATEENNGIYRLKAADYTQAGNWEKAGAGATVDLNAIDTQLNTATEIQPVDVTPDKYLYFLGKLKISMANFIELVVTQFQGIYAAINHNHTLASLSEKSYNSLTDKPTIPEAQVNADWNATEGVAKILNKPTIPSIAGLMVESEYTGETGTKQVNYAKSADEAEQAIHSYSANQDALGREIHTTYALKDSGITPPVNETVDLNNDTPTYTVTDATAPLLSVTNAADAGGEVILPTNLTADKSISIQIFRNDTIINGVTYSDGDTVFASFEYDTASWYITDTEIPEVPDYSDMTVDVMIDNPTITPKPGYIRITGHVWTVGTKVFLRTTDTPTPIGIYQCVGAGAGYSNLVLIAAGTALHTVRVKSGDVLYSQYDGANAASLVFLKAGEYTDDFINVPDGVVTVNLKKSQILGLCNATGAGLTNVNTITFALPTPVAGAFNQSVVYFEVGATLPTIVQPANTLIFGTLILNSNTKYKLQYDQIRMSATSWQRTLNFSKV